MMPKPAIFLLASLAMQLHSAGARAEEDSTGGPPRSNPAPENTQAESARGAAERVGIIRVNSTVQSYDFYRPWDKKQPSPLRGIGAVIEGGRVLVGASMVANLTYIELEKAGDAVKCEAIVEVVDYDANLAIVRPREERFLDGISPMAISENVNVGDIVAVLQLESGGTLATSPGRVTGIQLTRYLASEAPLLTFKVTLPLQYRDGSNSLPVVDASGALAGLMLRYEARSQVLDTVPAPVIAHFLADLAKPPYEGFPRAGIRFAPLRDPVLRAHLEAPPGGGGVFVEGVVKGGPADLAGIKVGDVLLRVGPFEVDADGNFEHPRLGELGAAHIFSTEFFAGEEIPLTILRNGKPLELTLKATTRKASDFAIPPHNFDSPPPYLVVGGIVLTELSRSYLNEWGARWETNAPLPLVYLDRYQEDLIEADSRVVVISQVLPTDDTVGYEEVRNARLLSVNGVVPKNLRDVAAALERPISGFLRLEIEEEPGLIVLDAERIGAIDSAVSKTYGIPALRRLE